MSNLNDVRFTFSTPTDEAISFDVVSFELNERVTPSATPHDQTGIAGRLTTALIQEGR